MYGDVPLVLVQEAGARAAAARDIGHERAVALGTEADSLHRYHEKVCLLQVSVPGCDYVIDPLAVPDLSPLAPILEDPGVVKILVTRGAGARGYAPPAESRVTRVVLSAPLPAHAAVDAPQYVAAR